jgi:hypothetical protein
MNAYLASLPLGLKMVFCMAVKHAAPTAPPMVVPWLRHADSTA